MAAWSETGRISCAAACLEKSGNRLAAMKIRNEMTSPSRRLFLRIWCKREGESARLEEMRFTVNDRVENNP
jgi:hypothetical protein